MDLYCASASNRSNYCSILKKRKSSHKTNATVKLKKYSYSSKRDEDFDNSIVVPNDASSTERINSSNQRQTSSMCLICRARSETFSSQCCDPMAMLKINRHQRGEFQQENDIRSSENCTNCVVKRNSTISSSSSSVHSTWNGFKVPNVSQQMLTDECSCRHNGLLFSDQNTSSMLSHQLQSAPSSSIPPIQTALLSAPATTPPPPSSLSSCLSNIETESTATISSILPPKTSSTCTSRPSLSKSAELAPSPSSSLSVVSLLALPSFTPTLETALTQCSSSKTNALPSCNDSTCTNSNSSRVFDINKSTNLLSKSCAKTGVKNTFKINLNVLRTFSLIAIIIERCVIGKCGQQQRFVENSADEVDRLKMRQGREHHYRSWLPKYPVTFIVLSLMMLLLPTTQGAEIRLQRNETVCKSRDIRNTPSEFLQLANCTVIEGFLLITLIDFNRPNQSSYDTFSFPMLTEVTEFVVIYRVNGLRTLGTLFPNLSVIRGKELFEGFALVIYENTHLEDVGLRSLTTITRGAVRIEKNPELCFVKTIDWGQIAVNMTSEHHFFLENKKEEECAQCPGGSGKPSDDTEVSITCPVHQGRRYCWNNKFCQKICPSTCKTNCNDDLQCCNEACIGGCSTKNLNSCTSCRHFAKSDVCMDRCPPNFFSYLDRRCVTAETCTKVIGTKLEGTKQEYVVPFDGVCSVRCPPGHSKINATCVKCVGKCVKTCGGALIDSVGAAKQFHGCTHIVGSPLNISIKRGGRHLMEELEMGLSSIEEIDTFLKVHRTYGMVSLAFFKNLKRIKGLTLESGKFALYVLENQDLESIWGPNQTVEIERGRVFFHFNPKLCFSVIDELRAMMKDGAKFDKNEVAEDSNGSKGSCNTEVLNVEVIGTSSLSAIVNITNPMKFEDDRVFIGYQYFYTEDPFKNISMYGHRACEERWSSDDPSKDFEHVFLNLKPYTQYAFYVKTHTISSERRNGQSPIMYFRTKPDQPKNVQNLKAVSNSSSEVIVRWQRPTITNGNLTSYIITAKLDKTPDSKLKTRNFCNDPVAFKEASPEENIFPIIEKNNNNQACMCEKNETRNSSPNLLEEAVYENLIDFENNLQNFIYVKKTNDSEEQSRRRRRRAVDLYDAIQNKGITPPTTKTDPLYAGKQFIMDPTGTYYEFINISVNASVTEYVLTNLKHFALYTVTIRACREHEEGAPEKNCSPGSLSFARTHKLDDVDIIRNLQVELEQSNTTRSNLRIKWDPPERPNGLTTSYTIFYTDVNSLDAVHEKRCITEQDYQQNFSNGYVLTGLPTGNYSIRVRANSFAGDGIKSEPVFKYIPPNRITWQTITFIGIGILLFLVIVACVIYYLRKKFLAPPTELKIFPTVNPYYISMQYLPDEWEVPRDKIIQLGALGQGSFGMVYEGILKDFKNQPDTPCAIKTVNENATDRERLNFLKEASVMKQFKTHHVVRLLGVCSRGQPALVIMELMKFGDLKAFLRGHRPNAEASIHGEPPQAPPTLERILQIAIEIADGMAYLAAKKFVHRDLAARNCMVAADLTVKIGDFGMTRDIYETDYYRKGTKGLLPVRWMAPESLKDGVFSSASDVFSYGVVLWEMATLASQPYQGYSNDQVLRFVIDGGVMDRPDSCPDKLYNLMQKCWQHRPGARPSFMEIIRYLLDSADPNFQKVSFYHSAEASEILEQMHPEHDLDDATTPLRVGEFQYKLNIDYNSSVELHHSPTLHEEDDEDDDDNDDNDPPHSPYSLASAMIISSTPRAHGKHSPNVIMNQSNPTLSLPSTSAAAIAASTVAPAIEAPNLNMNPNPEHSPEDPLYEFNEQPINQSAHNNDNTSHSPIPFATQKTIKTHSPSPSSNRSKNPGSLKRVVASTVQNVSNSLRMPNFLQRRLFKNSSNLQSSGGNRGKRYSDTKSESSNNGIRNNSNEGSMSSNVEAGTTGLRPFFTGLTPSHTSKNPNYQILDESLNTSANRDVQKSERETPRRENQLVHAADDNEDNSKSTSNSNSALQDEHQHIGQCKTNQDDDRSSQSPNRNQFNKPSSTLFQSPEVTSPTTSVKRRSRKTSEEVALIPISTSLTPKTPYQLKENWLKQMPQPPPNGFIGREG